MLLRANVGRRTSTTASVRRNILGPGSGNLDWVHKHTRSRRAQVGKPAFDGTLGATYMHGLPVVLLTSTQTTHGCEGCAIFWFHAFSTSLFHVEHGCRLLGEGSPSRKARLFRPLRAIKPRPPHAALARLRLCSCWAACATLLSWTKKGGEGGVAWILGMHFRLRRSCLCAVLECRE